MPKPRVLVTVHPNIGFGAPLMRGAPIWAMFDRIKAGEPLKRVAQDFEVPVHDLRLLWSATMGKGKYRDGRNRPKQRRKKGAGT